MNVAIDTIFCDDIRQEVSGKLILIGVYPDNLLVDDFPASLILSAWLRFSGLEEGTHQNTLRIKLDDVEVMAADGTIPSDGKSTSNGFVFRLPLKVEKPGNISVEIQFGETGVVKGRSLPISRRENAQDSTAK